MEQEIKVLVKGDDVRNDENGVQDWLLAGFENEDEYNELLKKIDAYLKTEELHPWVKAIAGMVNTGKEESTDTILD